MASPPSSKRTTMMKEDPVYQELMKGSSGSNASHNYYQEFRLGQGDPLMKASMKQWGPNTTVYNEEPYKRPRTTCTTLSNPMSGGRRGTWPGAHKQVPYDPTSDYCEYLIEDAS